VTVDDHPHIKRYRRLVPATDLDILPPALRVSARCEPNGEVAWPVSDAPAVINALADAGRTVLGLDLRAYADDGVSEVAWSDHSGFTVEGARSQALAALGRDDLPGEWVLVTW